MPLPRAEDAAKLCNRALWTMARSTRPVPRIRDVFTRWNSSASNLKPALEFVRFVPGPAYIEPNFGYVITADGVLIDESMTPQFSYPKAIWRNGIPAYREVVERIRSGDASAVTKVETAVSMRHFWEYNYYHFHLDVLGKLPLLDEAGVTNSSTLVFGRYVHQLPFARQIMSRGGLAERRILVPPLDNTTVIRAEKGVYYCCTLRSYRERMDPVMDEMHVPVPGASPDSARGRRIFLTRRPPATRSLSNIGEVESLLSRHGFEVIDTTSGMTADEQIAVFNQSSIIVALHGAGMVNTLYRRGARLSVVELHADQFVSADMKNISADYGYSHYRLSGPLQGRNPLADDYYIDIRRLSQLIREIIATG